MDLLFCCFVDLLWVTLFSCWFGLSLFIVVYLRLTLLIVL